jgi:heparan-alpha-glucosaminide N-acetyltransferase
MILMMAEIMEFTKLKESFPESSFWQMAAFHQTHVDWEGCSLHDLIQPMFSLLVGVVLPFSLLRRATEGQSALRCACHAFGRALVLVLLGVFLRSVGEPQTNWTFEDTLTQIGLGYGFLYLIAQTNVRTGWLIFGLILGGYWLWFVTAGIPGGPWALHANAAETFDRWFLNLFPRAEPFIENEGGYSTLNFIPTLATMILGLQAGRCLLADLPVRRKLRWLCLVGLGGIILGYVLGATGICPIVKKIWTPAWVLFSGGWCLWLLAGFYLLIDIWQVSRWAYVFVVVGMNSIAAYVIAHLWVNFMRESLVTHFGMAPFQWAGPAYETLLLGAVILGIEWLILWAMYRRRWFVRI